MIAVWALVVIVIVGAVYVIIAKTTGDKTNDQEGVLGTSVTTASVTASVTAPVASAA